MILRILTGWLIAAALLIGAGPGFRSKKSYDDHYAKHRAEFGKITKVEYLELAQELRDAQADGKVILEAKRADGVITRFHRKKGHFGAYNPDRTIRTFFVPNDGERYFRRQAQRQ
jgi:pyocin large subunit-like protein